MDIFKNEKALFKNGGFKSAFKWSLVAFPVIFVLNILGIALLNLNFLAGIFLMVVVSNAALAVICYFALKRGIQRFGLKTYSLRADYVSVVVLLLLAYTFLVPLVLTGEVEFPRVGLPPLIIMLLMPYFVKK